MSKVKQKIKNIFTYFLVPLLLFLLGSQMFYKYLFDNGFGFFNLLTPGTSSDLISTRSGELLAGDIVFGKFSAKYPNMGIVSVRFDNRNRDSNDELIFRLKEEGESGWYYEAKYKTDQFLPGKLFPFGFPSVKDSDGRSYIFELESVRGATGSGIFLDGKQPAFMAASFFDKNEILSSRAKTISFLSQKLVNVIGDKENLITVLIYFSPLFFYLLYLFTIGSSYHILVVSTLIPIFYDLFYLPKNIDFLLISIIFLWYLTVRRFRFESRISAVFALGFLVLTPILLITNSENFAEKSAVWAYLFLCATVVQQIYELKKKPKKLYTLNKFFANVFNIKIDKNNNRAKVVLNIIVLLVTCLVIKKFYQSLVSIQRAYLLFWEFYPGGKIPPNLIFFCIAIFALVLVFVFIAYLKRQNLWSNKLLILVWLFAFQAFSGSLEGKFTKFQYQPKMFSLSPSVTSEAWVDVTINGVNFQDLPFVGKVFIAGIEQGEYIIHWSDKKIIVRTNPTVTKSGPVCVQTLSKGNTNCLPFLYNFGKK